MRTLFVDNESKLLELCQLIADSDVVAIDTEFMREKTYYAQLCLIQLATDKVIACVDPLAISDMSPLLDLLYQPERLKILHAARQDLEIFFDQKGEIPKPIYDTQVAATLLGHGDQLGYAKLVNAMMSVEVDKDHSRTDWSKRPLDEAQVRYAENDVRYLIPMYREQMKRLSELGRETWLQVDFDNLSDLKLYAPNLKDIWKRIKGTRILKRNQFAVIQQLAIWREEKARKSNCPRKWVIADDAMIDLARRLPQTTDAMEQLRGWKSSLKKYADELLDQIERSVSLPENQWPKLERHVPLSVQQDALVDFLMGIVRLRAIANEVTPTVLATRKELEKLVLKEKDLSVLTGWRFEFVGNDLMQFLDGRKTISIIDDTIKLEQK
jgi:ribonuclease D